uniref:Myosin light chain alkali n=1 Tax=Lygus hesperus TaxID=30085 RepID=A0A0A9Y366_LYGHE
MTDLSDKEIEKATFAFGIYDFEGIGTMDAFQLGNCLRALGLNPTAATVEKLGGTKKKGEKQLTIEEFLPIFSQAKKDKDCGVYEDFVECMKLYDKEENGLMVGAELSHILLTLGDKLTEAECSEVLKDCLDPEDEDGMVPYVPFLARIAQKPVPDSIVP